jgi:hypothetical protein
MRLSHFLDGQGSDRRLVPPHGSSLALAAMKIKSVISVFLLLVSLLLVGCASLDRSAADGPVMGCNQQEEESVKPGEEPLLDLLYCISW